MNTQMKLKWRFSYVLISSFAISPAEFTITVNWRRKDGNIATTQLGTLDRGACRSAEDVGLQLADAKAILGRLWVSSGQS
jgi:hypothetical protein